MRVLLLPAIAMILGAPSLRPRADVQPMADMPVVNPEPERSDCPETPMSLARKQGQRLQGQPLNELPDAMLFGAVDRRVDGCSAPLVLSRQPAER
ncbi:MAG: hypothetical protein AVDCRST_MAG62-164 [uncultured Sphingomonas sp.]|uniref:Uncharacterized protein n=1 Tax=uncultured Sphingomonas sp. TaxID=158754 RepID=A0A6J4ST50_9SPHN|nr:MAG: hypothetical protein AVDCRST_MAG62-164 [uncultured Sphingomonas sp.]